MTQNDLFDRYLATLRARHEQGRKEYGDRSMDKPRAELLGEMQQEAVDIAGWGFFLWAQMEKMKGEPSERDAVEQSWFRKMMDLQAVNNAEIRRLKDDLREAVSLLSEVPMLDNTKMDSTAWLHQRDFFVDSNKEKSDE